MISLTPFRHILPPLLIAATLCGCTAEGPKRTVVQPGPPGASSKVLSVDDVGQPDSAKYTKADVRFVQGMIRHHAQALRMTGLVAGRSTSKDVPLFAERITVSQEDEIALMLRWLRARLEEVPNSTGTGHDHGGLMPGMLTEEQFADLEKAEGAAFDRLFYEFMIYHHTGAIQMVEGLFADGGGEEPEVYQIATHVDADQRIEIDRMRRLLAAMGAAGNG
ncbi:DUF305 domain-containing protein [Microtetraspora glauca]|uniref:DUF305 domain-containing protein n=1 Tax=Microtetraspora glauca TaxID=1996 RepID=A0ABV3GQQ6_MICGL